MNGTADVVVVGGGIAGSALAAVLARSGHEVAVLERQTVYRDKVRGEVMACWGVAELQRLGLERPLLAAGGCYASRAVPYDEVNDPTQAEAGAMALDQLLPGVPGTLNVGHPEACEALAQAAATAGATVVRGAGDVQVEPGPAPAVRYTHDGTTRRLRCRLVVGADGRRSTVRRQGRIPLHETTPRTMCGGLLVDGLHAWPAGQLAEGTEGDLHFYVLPRTDGRARLYLLHDIAQKGRFAGAGRDERFLQAFGFRCIPGSEMFGAAQPVRQCAFHPLNDSWTDVPFAPGVVLIGDAAGWNDPIIGQGLAIAMRDVRWVSDILATSAVWSPEEFRPYGEERRERLRRLRVTARVKTDLAATFTPAGAARRRAYSAVWESDPVLAGPQLAPLLGPDSLPAEAFAPTTIDRILALT
ncbi:FAD-dependent oxidoreductase [Streptomyces sp. NPDC046870]|uniref:FAD-dependent oxidoreductase n=1 Tax=Streptomyces sp. NPDC046870 TaxID=3155135 RepID=UPI0034546ED8